MNTSTVKPWYREPWPWYLASGPLIVVVASLVTAWIAYSTSDGLVTDDYYKQGLAVDRTLARSKEAASLGLEVRARFTAEGVNLGLISAADSNFAAPKALNLTLSHPTRAGLGSDGDADGGRWALHRQDQTAGVGPLASSGRGRCQDVAPDG